MVVTSEGVTRREIGRHRWAYLTPMWNLPKEGFRQLYDQTPGEKPPFEEVWRATGGNSKLLGEGLYEASWRAEAVAGRLVRQKKLGEYVQSLGDAERALLRRALDDPDTLMTRDGIPLLERLVDLNLVVDELYPRDPWYWAGEGLRARHWKACSLADAASQRGCEGGAGGRVAHQLLNADTRGCGGP